MHRAIIFATIGILLTAWMCRDVGRRINFSHDVRTDWLDDVQNVSCIMIHFYIIIIHNMIIINLAIEMLRQVQTSVRKKGEQCGRFFCLPVLLAFRFLSMRNLYGRKNFSAELSENAIKNQKMPSIKRIVYN